MCQRTCFIFDIFQCSSLSPIPPISNLSLLGETEKKHFFSIAIALRTPCLLDVFVNVEKECPRDTNHHYTPRVLLRYKNSTKRFSDSRFCILRRNFGALLGTLFIWNIWRTNYITALVLRNTLRRFRHTRHAWKVRKRFTNPHTIVLITYH